MTNRTDPVGGMPLDMGPVQGTTAMQRVDQAACVARFEAVLNPPPMGPQRGDEIAEVLSTAVAAQSMGCGVVFDCAKERAGLPVDGGAVDQGAVDRGPRDEVVDPGNNGVPAIPAPQPLTRHTPQDKPTPARRLQVHQEVHRGGTSSADLPNLPPAVIKARMPDGSSLAPEPLPTDDATNCVQRAADEPHPPESANEPRSPNESESANEPGAGLSDGVRASDPVPMSKSEPPMPMSSIGSPPARPDLARDHINEPASPSARMISELSDLLDAAVTRLASAPSAAGATQVRLEFKADVLPGVTAVLQQAGGRIQVDFFCAAEASRQLLSAITRREASDVARRCRRDLLLRIHSQDPEQTDSVSVLEILGAA